ncbi:MAG: DUF255 domain-containing protein [Bacteroidetes bacterium]|jgi:uncharacterized protein YyaL (SSP411 family)|nr:DUF255 domain-containing protein [Bacteroidota bacterium]
MNKPYKNKLSEASSPYLLQHANNPVDWHEWGPEALEKAKNQNKPLIISIGYAACHWCHVMEHESFMDDEVAKLMNDHFITIKVDREERPDIDQIYMDAAQLITGQGGWPLNAFALPDGRPFYAATYFPKEQWSEVLKQLHEVFQNEYDKVLQQAQSLTEGINKTELLSSHIEALNKSYDPEYYRSIFPNWEKMIDSEKGGYARAPKFPLPVGWEFLLQYYYLTNNTQALESVLLTLNEMAKGGIYDQIGGGFARYSVDAEWKVPHFEKMLYDNGQLISLYANAFKLGKNPEYAEVIHQTIEFIEKELMHPEGGFYASLNADSEGEEGKFYVWTQEEIHQTLDEKEADIIEKYYQIIPEGNWEHGKNILHRKFMKNEFAQHEKMEAEELETILNNASQKLMNQRDKRIRPSTDDKIITSWNALMLKGLVDAYMALKTPRYLETALSNAHFLKNNMVKENGELWRNYKDGKVSIMAFLDDYALLSEAFIKLYEVTFDKQWLDLAKKLTDYAIDHFYDEAADLFFYTSDQSEKLIARKKEIQDNVIPASNSVIVHVLYLLGEYYDEQHYTEKAQMMICQILKDIPEGGPYYANWGKLLGMMTHQPVEVVITGNEAVNKAFELQKHFLPTCLFMGGSNESLPLMKNKVTTGESTIYVCHNKVCDLPVKEVDAALEQIQSKN